ncbi:MAG TPA: 16S rRNA (guanine(966)-N(2))-methyltransferase RsmD, partial [Pseudomonadales bacterium]|nr:16S rRNA (guanine(966)-N(2))-methyltransferase RsmD [Pseudomonadales bacterium]
MKKNSVPLSELRIIGGQWRGRKLRFAAVEGVRPTGDRIRETLFNWLMFDIEDTRCLDLFAGSGALGFEAASRGAREVVLIDRHPKVVEQLNENAKLLNFGGFEIEKTDAEHFLGSKPPAFDIVFLDPPFAEDKTAYLLDLLEKHDCLADPAL